MMGSTGDADRKRRHVSSTSPTDAVAKKQPFLPISEDKKLDTGLVVYKNQKLLEAIETNKIEIAAREKEYKLLQDKLIERGAAAEAVKRSWKDLNNRLESYSVVRAESISERDKEESPSCPENALHGRLKETGATESSSLNNCMKNIESDKEVGMEKSRLLRILELTVEDLGSFKGKTCAAVVEQFPDNGSSMQKTSIGFATEVKSLRIMIADLHIKHRPVAWELQRFRNADAQKKVEIRRLKGELERVFVELDETHKKLAPLKAEHDARKGSSFPPFNFGNKNLFAEKVRAKQRDLRDVESILTELQDQASSRLEEVRMLHEERIKIFQQLSTFLKRLNNVRSISSSQPWLLLKNQIEKSKSEVIQCQSLYDKLQKEKDNLAWKEMELSIKGDMVDVYRRCSAVADSRMTDLGIEIQKQINERNRIELVMAESSNEPGRQEIITDFKALLSTFPEEMQMMQSQLSKCKEDAVDIHSMRAEVQSLSSMLNRKVEDCKILLRRSADHETEIRKLKTMIQDLKQSDLEMKLFLDMYRRESVDSRDVTEAKELEYKSWAHVQSLKSSLDEHNLELRVKTAIEAEASSQQRLATAEAEIAELRQKLEISKREITRLTAALKSKIEENEAYISEIESIGQAYDDMQSQNQHLLQQITERDDYNIKLVLEGVKARQTRDSLVMEKHALEKQIQQATASNVFFSMKVGRMEDQLKINSEKVQKLGEDRMQSSFIMDNTQKRLSEVRKISLQVSGSLEELQSQAVNDRGTYGEEQIELERDRFKQKRIEEGLEAVKRKVALLQAEKEGSVTQKLQHELEEYKEIVKCSLCLERSKEVVITKCYHLFCSACIQRVIETRHRKCPVCTASFGPNDVKPVYI